MLGSARSKLIFKEIKSRSSDISQLVTSASSLNSLLQNELGRVQQTSGDRPEDRPEDRPADLACATSQQIQTLPTDQCNLQQESALRLLRFLPMNHSVLSMTPQQKDLSEPSTNPRTSCKPYSKPRSAGSSHEISTYDDSSKNGQTSQDLLQPWGTARGSKRPQKATRSVTESWNLAIYNLTVGTMTVRKISQRTEQTPCRKQDHRTSSAVTFTLYPAPWIANKIIELGFGLRNSQCGSPSISLSLGSRSYNQNPLLIDCLHNGDISGLETLFANGEAKPTDILAPWGNTFLHVSL